MSYIKNGGPAFPVGGGNMRDLFGMTMRDYFAAKAMQAFISSRYYENYEDLPKSAYKIADAMLAEREK